MHVLKDSSLQNWNLARLVKAMKSVSPENRYFSFYFSIVLKQLINGLRLEIGDEGSIAHVGGILLINCSRISCR